MCMCTKGMQRQNRRTGRARFYTQSLKHHGTHTQPPPPQHIHLHIDSSPVELKIDKTDDDNERK